MRGLDNILKTSPCARAILRMIEVSTTPVQPGLTIPQLLSRLCGRYSRSTVGCYLKALEAGDRVCGAGRRVRWPGKRPAVVWVAKRAEKGLDNGNP